MTAPQTPDKLIGSKWTSTTVDQRRKHWEVTSYQPDTGRATLRAVIDGHTEAIPWRNLRNRDDWQPGWQ